MPTPQLNNACPHGLAGAIVACTKCMPAAPKRAKAAPVPQWQRLPKRPVRAAASLPSGARGPLAYRKPGGYAPGTALASNLAWLHSVHAYGTTPTGNARKAVTTKYAQRNVELYG